VHIDYSIVIDSHLKNGKEQTKKAFLVVTSLIRIHLISMLKMGKLLQSTNQSYKVKIVKPLGQLKLML
jgi:hypothetical protein